MRAIPSALLLDQGPVDVPHPECEKRCWKHAYSGPVIGSLMRNSHQAGAPSRRSDAAAEGPAAQPGHKGARPGQLEAGLFGEEGLCSDRL